MKLFISNFILRTFWTTVCSYAVIPLFAQESIIENTRKQSMFSHNSVIERKTKYERSVERYHHVWRSLIPSYFKIHLYGDMGLFSLGTGWNYGKRNQWETDVFLGVIPRYSSNKVKMTFTTKQNLIPWHKRLTKRWYIDPLTCSLYFSTILSNEFWVREPERYPKGYYGFSTKIRTNISIGQRFVYYHSQSNLLPSKNLTFYYEICTCDIYVLQAFKNSYLKPQDYLNIAFGIKVQLL